MNDDGPRPTRTFFFLIAFFAPCAALAQGPGYGLPPPPPAPSAPASAAPTPPPPLPPVLPVASAPPVEEPPPQDTPALARPWATEAEKGSPFGLRFDIGVHGGFARKLPDAEGLTTPNGFPFAAYGAPVVPGTPTALVGFQVDLGYRTKGPLYVPLLGARGDYVFTPTIRLTTRAGSDLLLEQRGYYGVLLPGLGFELGDHDVHGGISVRPAVSYSRFEGAFTQGELTVDAVAARWYASVRADAWLCVGKGFGMGCLYVAPNLYSGGNAGAFDGGMVGLRFGARGL